MSNVPYDPGAATGQVPGTDDTPPYPYGVVAYTDGSGNGSIVTSVNGLPVAIVGTPSITVSNFPATQPVSGTFWQATQPVSAAALPLPTGAATEATLSALSGKVTACNTGAVTIAAALPAGTNVIGGVAGDVAAGATDSGNPVKIGGYASQAPPTAVTAGQRANIWTSPNGAVVTARQGVGNPSDNNGNSNFVIVGNSGGGAGIENAAYLFNNTSWDRNRNNYEVSQFASAARTTSQNGADQTNYNARGIVVVLNVSAGGGGSGSLTFKVQGKDTLSGQYYDILTSAAITGASVNAITVYPGVTVAANGAASFPLPRIWRVVVTAFDTTSFTYSVAANYIN